MKTNRWILVLVSVTIIMQAAIMYRQYFGASTGNPRRQPSLRDAPKGMAIDVAELPMRGNKDAKVALIEFSDYECPFCARHATGVGSDLDKEFVATGKVKHVFVNNPLPIHPNARLLATAAICAGDQGQYWQMHDVLFEAKPTNREQVLPLAHTLGIQEPRFQQCIDSDVGPKQRIESDIETAKKLEFGGTPSFAIGRADAQGHVHIDKLVVGAEPLAVFEKAIQESLQKS